MANFKTHLGAGVAISSLAVLGVQERQLASIPETQVLFLVGVAASLLPDIDADDSKPLRWFFSIAGALLGFLAASALVRHVGNLELGLIWAGVWFAVNYPLRALFSYFTVHRGIWHSLLMAVVLALLGAVVARRGFDADARLTWLVAGFMLLGYLTHLVLDELASVDLLGRHVKRSFGTALKPLSLRAWPASLLLIALLFGLLRLLPEPPAEMSRLSVPRLDWDWLAPLCPRCLAVLP